MRRSGSSLVEEEEDMDFEDQEERGLPGGSSYESRLCNSSRGGLGGKIGGGGGGELGTRGGTGNRRPASGGGGGKYRECLKNHAVTIGGYAVDGCGEFMAAGEEGSLDALKCAACNCHRNFHRKETECGGRILGVEGGGFHHQFSPYHRTPPAGSYLHHHQQVAAHLPLALRSTSGRGAQSRDNQEDVVPDPMVVIGGGEGAAAAAGGGGGKKRLRTKFTPEQKNRMLALAERLGWKIQKQDEAAVKQFCTENCVKRHVFKVWMHNNKHSLGKKP